MTGLAIDAVNRSQMIAAAKQELAALKAKLEEILDKERGLLFSRSGLERAVAECKQRNKRPGRSP